MKLGEFAGITGMMLVLCNDTVPEKLIDVIYASTGKSAIRALDRELVSLLRVRSFVKYRAKLSLDAIGDGNWQNGSWSDAEMTDVVRRVFLDNVKAVLLNKGIVTWDPAKADEFLATNDWDDLLSASRRCSKMCSGGVQIDVADLVYEVPDRVKVDNKYLEVTKDIKTFIEILLSKQRLIVDTIKYIRTQSSDSIVEVKVFNVNAMSTISYKPSLFMHAFTRYAETAKSLSNASALHSYFANIRVELDKLKMVSDHMITSNGGRIHSDAVNSPSGVKEDVWRSMTESVRGILTECLSKDWSLPFPYDGDVNKFGEELVEYGMYGVNDKTVESVKASINGGFLSDARFTVSNEVKQSVDDIYNIIRAYVDTQLPVGADLMEV